MDGKLLDAGIPMADKFKITSSMTGSHFAKVKDKRAGLSTYIALIGPH